MADENYYLRRDGWKITRMSGCPKDFPFEQEVTFLVGKVGTPGKYRVAWLDKSGGFRYLDNLSLTNGLLEVTVSIGKQKWKLTGKPVPTANGKPRLEGSVKTVNPSKSSGKTEYEGGTGGTWHAEGNGGG